MEVSHSMEGRIPPYNMEAEVAVLGSIIMNNRSMELLGGLEVEHFYVEANRRIFGAIVYLSSKGQPVDHVTLGSCLMERGDLDKVGGAMGLNDLTKDVVTTANVGHYAVIVKKLSVLRKMIYVARDIASEGFRIGAEEAEDFLANARSSITIAADGLGISKGPVYIDDELKEVFNDLETGEEPRGLVKTGLGPIDRSTGGLWPGILTICAGRPGMGKSAFILNIATNAALAGYKVLYVTLEDVRKFVVLRMLSRFADIDLQDLILRRIDKNKWKDLQSAANSLSGNKPLWIEDASGLTSKAIRQLSASHKNLHGLDLLVVDHLGEVSDTGENETSITTNAARAFRDIAKELNIPVLLAHQLNRKVEERTDKRPNLGDLRQSGAIEAIARFVWFLYRPGYYKQDGENDNDLQLIVAKASHGVTGTLRLWCDLSRMYIRGWEYGEDGLFPGSQKDREAKKENKPVAGHQGGFFGNQHWTENDKDY